MGENNLYIHNVDLVDPVDLDPQFYFARHRKYTVCEMNQIYKSDIQIW